VTDERTVPDDLVPTEVDVDRAHHVALTWLDGTRTTFELEDLRLACPCAECRGRREQGRAPWQPGPVPLSVVAAELVGGWGISLTWSDGHGTGIYSWEALHDWAGS
jgi:DUF971 family protein